MCGLEAYADAVVGTLGVEHKKRTTIAVELAAKVFTSLKVCILKLNVPTAQTSSFP